MSIWTHVVGCIRVDGIPELGARKDAVEAILGPMCLFEAWDEASILPRGSEGGLQYRVIEYDHGCPWLAIPVWGDLRGYDDVDAIRAWWERTLVALQPPRVVGWVRDAVLRVEVEGRAPVILVDSTVAEPELEPEKDLHIGPPAAGLSRG